jgi:hypothetical protein
VHARLEARQAAPSADGNARPRADV